MDLLDSRDVGATEFDLLRLAVSWQQQHGASAGVALLQLVDNIDFAALTPEQCEYAISAGVPRELVFNDLVRSQLLSSHQVSQLGDVGQLPWRLFDAGAVTSERSWQQLHTAATKFTKKLLLLQCHDPPQTIALYLPHQHPGDGLYPCATHRSDGQQLSAITWAFGVDGFSRKQLLSGQNIDLDSSEQRLQIYRPRRLHPGQAPALDDPSSRANSYLWLRLQQQQQQQQQPLPQQQQHAEQGAADVLSSCTDGVLLELVLAVMRSAGSAPELADADAFVQQLKAAGEQAVAQKLVQGGVSDAQLQAVPGGAQNAAQEAAVKAAAQQRLALIWGPPGTGKTHTIVQLLRVMLCQQQGGTRSSNPMVCAETHTATDNILAKLIASGKTAGAAAAGGEASHGTSGLRVETAQLLRIGDVGRVSPELRSCTLDALGDKLTNAAGFLDMKKVRAELASKRVVFATCAAAGASILQAAGIQFSTVIVDEATQESFERLLACGAAEPHMLTTQYRMHPGIAALPSSCFYGGLLDTHYSNQSCPTLGPCLQPGISLVDVEGRENAAGSSWLNRDEAQAVDQLLRQLLSPKGDGSGSSSSSSSSSSVLVARGIGIITPYKAMVQELRSVMARVPGAGEVEVNTVDAFQGRAKDVIIFCSVRCNSGGRLGFVADARSLNVAVTRAGGQPQDAGCE
ncbi:hypothetical protein OEZ86_000144 [Tetradesmus obliquus]|nr:hypothetical protein OEZ86_000144 [Tetradesmus obliquus]